MELSDLGYIDIPICLKGTRLFFDPVSQEWYCIEEDNIERKVNQ